MGWNTVSDPEPSVARRVSNGKAKGRLTPDAQCGTTQREPLLRLLAEWRRDDVQDQRETWEYLRAALDESRVGQRKLFP